MCVQEMRNCNTNCTLLRVCDHKKFMSIEIVLFFNNVLGTLINPLVLHVVVAWKVFCHQFVFVRGLKNSHQQRLN